MKRTLTWMRMQMGGLRQVLEGNRMATADSLCVIEPQGNGRVDGTGG
jgi:hypothetical protein